MVRKQDNSGGAIDQTDNAGKMAIDIAPANYDEFEQNNLFALVNNTQDLMWSVDRNYKLITSNKSFDGMVQQMIGKSIAKGSDVLAIGFSDDQLMKYKKLYARAFSGETFKVTEYTELPAELWSELSFHPIHSGAGVIGTACYSRDITDQKIAEQKIIHTQRLYAFISQINQTISHSTDEKKLFNDSCSIAIEIGKFELAWIGISDPANRKLNIVAHCNATAGDLDFFNDGIYDDQGPTASVMHSGKPYIINDFSREPENSSSRLFAEKSGFRSFIVLPIMKAGMTIGSFNLFSAQGNFFNEDELQLLVEATGDISYALDIFEKEKHRKLMVDKVIHSESRLKQAQAIAHIGSWEYDLATGVFQGSEEACRIYGLEPTDNCQVYESWVSFIHPDDIDYAIGFLKKKHGEQGSSALYYRIIRKDGEVRYIYTQSQYEFNDKGDPVVLHGVSHDVTEMKEAKKSLAQSEANLRQIMDLLPQSIFAKDYNGNFIFINKSFASLYGVKPEGLITKSIFERIPIGNETGDSLRQDREVILSGETTTIPEHPFTDHLGATHILHTVKVPFIVAATNENAVLGIIIDITEQKQIETERTKIIADIVQRNNDLEQFSYIVSHNLRAPVASILGLVNIRQTIETSVEDENLITEGLFKAAQNLDNVIRDINHILDLKHVLNEKRVTIKLEDLLTEVEMSIGDCINNGLVQIISDFSEAEEITTIKSYLYSIFYNLISNSIKYKRPRINAIIEISAVKKNNTILLKFKDNGLGIDLEKNDEYLFGLYKRFHYHTEGKGMGLFMVKTQVESLGGKITVISEVNKGSEFNIEFELDKTSHFPVHDLTSPGYTV
jgi:PAS domain S-box-containing protein